MALLVTTQSRFLAGSSLEHYTLDVLDRTASRAFLAALSGRDLDCEAGVSDLLRHLDGHALALELAGAYLREFPSVSCAAYLRQMTAGKNVEGQVSDLVRYERTVYQALNGHASHLDEPAQRALRTAACFAPEDASLALLEACGIGAKALRPVRRLHLISGDGDRWRMHRLVRTWAVDSVAPEALDAARRAFVAGCAAYALSVDLAEGYRIYHADGPHLEKAVAEIGTVLGEGDVRASELFDRVGTALHSAGDLHCAKELLELALASDLKSFGATHPPSR